MPRDPVVELPREDVLEVVVELPREDVLDDVALLRVGVLEVLVVVELLRLGVVAELLRFVLIDDVDVPRLPVFPVLVEVPRLPVLLVLVEVPRLPVFPVLAEVPRLPVLLVLVEVPRLPVLLVLAEVPRLPVEVLVFVEDERLVVPGLPELLMLLPERAPPALLNDVLRVPTVVRLLPPIYPCPSAVCGWLTPGVKGFGGTGAGVWGVRM